MNGSRLLVAALAACAALAGAPAVAKVGDVQFVLGDVRVLDPAGKARAVKRGDLIDEGETILTGADGNAQLLMIDKTRLTVRPSTELKFTEFRYQKNPETDRGLLSLTKGVFRTVTGLIGRTNRARYQVATPNATIGIRGSQGLIGHLDSGSWLLIEDLLMSMQNQGGELVGGKGDIFNAPNPFSLLRQNFLPDDMKNVQTTDQQQQAQKGGQKGGQGGDGGARRGAGGDDDPALAAGGGGGGGAGGGGLPGDTGGNLQNSLTVTVVSEDGEVINITGEGTVDGGGGGGFVCDPACQEALAAALQSLISSLESAQATLPQIFNTNDPTATFQSALTSAQTAGSGLLVLQPIDTVAINSTIQTASSALTTLDPTLTTLNSATAPSTTQVQADLTTAQGVQAVLTPKVTAANTVFNTPLVGDTTNRPDAAASTTIGILNPAATAATTALTAATTAVTTLTTAVTTFTTEKTNANTAFQTAQTELTNAQTALSGLAAINTSLSSAQTLASSQLSQLQTALTNAQSAFNLAQQAAQAAIAAAQQAQSAVSAGNFDQASLSLSQGELAFTQLQNALNALGIQVTTAVNLKAALESSLATQSTALASAGSPTTNLTQAVTAAQTAVTAANTALTTAQTQLTAAQTQLTTAQTQATIANTNLGPQVAWKNPRPNPAGYAGVVYTAELATSGYRGVELTHDTTSPVPTDYALHQAGYPAVFRNGILFSTDTLPCSACPSGDLTFSEGASPATFPQELFRTTDGTIYVGRLVGGQISANIPAPYIIGVPGAASSHFMFAIRSTDSLLFPIGTLNYVRIGGTSPTDLTGAVGSIIDDYFRLHYNAFPTVDFGFKVVFGGGLSRTISVDTVSSEIGLPFSPNPTSVVSNLFASCNGTGCAGGAQSSYDAQVQIEVTGSTSGSTLPHPNAGMIYQLRGLDAGQLLMDVVTGTNVYGNPHPGRGAVLAYAFDPFADAAVVQAAPATLNDTSQTITTSGSFPVQVDALTNTAANGFSFDKGTATHTAGSGTGDFDGGFINWGRWGPGGYAVSDSGGPKTVADFAHYMYSDNLTHPDKLASLLGGSAAAIAGRLALSPPLGAAATYTFIGGDATSRGAPSASVTFSSAAGPSNVAVDFINSAVAYNLRVSLLGTTSQVWNASGNDSVAAFRSPTGIGLTGFMCSGSPGCVPGVALSGGKATGQFVGPNVNAIISSFALRAADDESLVGTLAVTRSAQ